MSRKYMSDEMFNELMESMNQAVAIIKGEMKPSRVFVYSPLNVKKIRENAKKNQEEFAHMIGVSIGTLRN
ncbi:MAG: transcriptional regulator, partial [Spirochaetia bacterium]|nr:transcriptional regulator [Spirochaetia bacterium]